MRAIGVFQRRAAILVRRFSNAEVAPGSFAAASALPSRRAAGWGPHGIFRGFASAGKNIEPQKSPNTMQALKSAVNKALEESDPMVPSHTRISHVCGCVSCQSPRLSKSSFVRLSEDPFGLCAPACWWWAH